MHIIQYMMILIMIIGMDCGGAGMPSRALRSRSGCPLAIPACIFQVCKYSHYSSFAALSSV